MIWRFKVFLLATVVSFLLTSCSSLINYYARNLTETTQKIILIPREALTENEKFIFAYEKEVISVKYKTFEELKSNLEIEIKNGFLTISLPPRSTIYLGEGRIFEQEFKEVIFQNDEADTIGTKALSALKVIKKSRKFPNKFALWYDFKGN